MSPRRASPVHRASKLRVHASQAATSGASEGAFAVAGRRRALGWSAQSETVTAPSVTRSILIIVFASGSRSPYFHFVTAWLVQSPMSAAIASSSSALSRIVDRLTHLAVPQSADRAGTTPFDMRISC